MSTGWRPVARVPSVKHLRVRFKQLCTDVALRRQKRRYRGGRPGASPARAGFVVGCQRSGTDMVLWTLDKSLDVDRFDENHRAAFSDCRIKSAAVRERLVERSNSRRVLFKPVCDSHNTAGMLSEHAQSRAVWVYRDYRDVAYSAVKRWGQMNLDWVNDLVRGGGDWGRRQWNRELVTPDRQAQLEALCKDELTPHGAAAVYWYLSNSTFFDQQLQDNPDVTLARYEDLVTRPADEFGRLCEFFGIAYRPEMTAGIFRSSVGHKSDSPISRPMAEACEELLARLQAADKGGDSQ